MLVREIQKDGKHIILVGTAHISKESAKLVEETIRNHDPDIVGVELDIARLSQLESGEKWRETNITEIIKNNQGYLFLITLLLSNLQKRIGDEIGIKSGSDMLSAVKAAREAGKPIALLDRDIRITMKRAFSRTRFTEKLKLAYSIIMMVFGMGKENISEEKIEELKKTDVMTELMGEFTKELPSLKEVLVDERDLYIADRIMAAKEGKIVAVVGAGHLDGIEKNILEGKKAVGLDNMEEKKSIIPKLLKYAFPLAIIALFAGIILAKGTAVGLNVVIAWFIATGILSALAVLLVGGHPFSAAAALLTAPIAAIHPLIAVGWIAGAMEAKMRTPKVKDIEGLQEINSYKDIVKNNATRIILVGAAANIGSTIGTIIMLPWIAAILLG